MRLSFLLILAVVFGVLSVGSTVFAAVELANVNGRVITDRDLQMALGGINETQRITLLKDPNSKRQILNGLIDQELLVQEAEKQKLDQDAEFKDAMNAFKKQFLANRLITKHLAPQLTEKSAKKYYDAHKQRFSTEQVHVQHILLSTVDQAKEMIKKAKEANSDFMELAEKNSKDPSAKNNRGDLGFITRDRFVPEFTEAAFNGSEGEIVGPIKTAFGFHVIKIIQKKPGKPLEFDEVELRVQNELRQDLTQVYVSKLRQQAKVKLNESNLK